MNVSYVAMQVLREFLQALDPLCGAEIIRKLQIGPGTAYPLLHRLEAEGWLEHAGTLPGVDVPDAKFYRITPEGRVQFLDRLARLTIAEHLWKTPENGPSEGMESRTEV